MTRLESALAKSLIRLYEACEKAQDWGDDSRIGSALREADEVLHQANLQILAENAK
jgi:hypothetical protein